MSGNKGKTGTVTGIRLAAVVLMVVAVSAVALLSVYQGIDRIFSQASFEDVEEMAQRDLEMAESFAADMEQSLMEWGSVIRGAGYTDVQVLLGEISQEARLREYRHLYLVDTDGFYYGSNGVILQIPQYDVLWERINGNSATLPIEQSGKTVFICGKIKPFTVEATTFCYAVAEFSVTAYQDAMNQRLLCTNACILSEAGEVIAGLPDWDAFGVSSAEKLWNAMVGRDTLSAVGVRSDGSYIFHARRFANQNWIFLGQYPVHEQTGLKRQVMMLCLALTVVLLFALVGLLSQFRRSNAQKHRIQALEHDKQCFEERVDSLSQSNQAKTEFIDRISYDIRTPLNSIMGYTTLTKRHILEPSLLETYVEKILNASNQLLYHLERGLGKEEPEKIPEIAATDVVDLNGRRVLVVEDNEMNREIVEAVLAESGLIMEYAVNGEEGFQKVATAKPGYYDLVLMDIQMPVMDGCEATRMIRRLRTKKLAEIPVLAMTASVTDADKRAAFQAGMDGYVEKPIHIDRLFGAIRLVLRKEVT